MALRRAAWCNVVVVIALVACCWVGGIAASLGNGAGSIFGSVGQRRIVEASVDENYFEQGRATVFGNFRPQSVQLCNAWRPKPACCLERLQNCKWNTRTVRLAADRVFRNSF